MTEPRYRPRRDADGVEKPAKPPLTERLREAVKVPKRAGADPVPEIGGHVPLVHRDPGHQPDDPPASGHHAAPRAAAAAGYGPGEHERRRDPLAWSLPEVAATVAVALLVSVISAALMNTPVVHGLSRDAALLVRAATVVVYYGILMAFVVWLAVRAGRPLIGAFALQPVADVRGAWGWSVGVFVAIRLAPFVYAVVVDLLGVKIPGGVVDPTTFFGASPVGFVLTVVLAGLFGPLVEEIVFRGVVYRGAAEVMPWWAAALASGVVFSLMHFNLYLFVPLTLVGFGLATLVHKTGSLRPAIYTHAAYNVSSIVLAWILAALRGAV
jgi:membrane protease YdiL (CAAX protease family)